MIVKGGQDHEYRNNDRHLDFRIGATSIFSSETYGERITGTWSYNVSDLPKKSANGGRSSCAVESGKKMRESV